MTNDQHDADASLAANILQGSKEEFHVQIDEQRYRLRDQMPTGRQLLDAAALRPADEYLVFMWLPDGQLEEVRLDETVDLRARGVESFITWRSDASFRFVIDGRRFEWGAPYVTGARLKALAGVPVEYGVWLEVHGAEDRPIADGEQLDLRSPGVEHFFTGKKTSTEGVT